MALSLLHRISARKLGGRVVRVQTRSHVRHSMERSPTCSRWDLPQVAPRIFHSVGDNPRSTWLHPLLSSGSMRAKILLHVKTPSGHRL